MIPKILSRNLTIPTVLTLPVLKNLKCFQLVSSTLKSTDKSSTAPFFTLESLVLLITDRKSQILRYDSDLLNVPNQNKTLLVIFLKNYVLRRIIEIITHKMAATITWDNIFRRCRISDASQKVKHRDYIFKLFQRLLTTDFITSFEPAKKFPDAKRSYGISFFYWLTFVKLFSENDLKV